MTSSFLGHRAIFFSFVSALALCFPLSACDGSEGTHDDHEDATEECATLGELCHGLSDDLADECHELGHDNDGDVCMERFDECRDHCNSLIAAGGAGGAEH